jgi:hypothetical protein
MKISILQTKSEERTGLFQKLRLAKPRIVHNARLSLKLDEAEAKGAQHLDRKLLESWAGPRLHDLVQELERAGRGRAVASEARITRQLAGPEEGPALQRRAAIFADLVTFTLAEQRLAEEARRGLKAGGVENEVPPTDEAGG